MVEILLDCLTKSVVLKLKVDKYKKHYKGRKKNYYRLLTIMDRRLNEKLEEHNRQNLDAQIGRLRQTTTVSTPNCPYWLKGYCMKGKSCSFMHDPALTGKVKDATPTTAAAPLVGGTPESGAQSPAVSGGGGQDKSKGQGKGKKGKDKQQQRL